MENTLTDNEKIKKCLKSYLTGKKYFDNDKDKSFEYFKQSLRYLNLIGKKDEFNDILKETEVECNKYITLTIENSIEKGNYRENINLFEVIETGDINILKNLQVFNLDFGVYDEEGNTPLHKAIKYGDTNFIKSCFKLGAPVDLVNINGHTILEFACLEKDPNMINFLLQNGASMKKHLYFRDGEKKHNSMQNQIDYSILLKLIFTYPPSDSFDELEFLLDFQKLKSEINFDNYLFEDLLMSLTTLLNSIDKDKKDTFIKIIREEITYHLKNSLDCPNNKLELILFCLTPFIEYPFNLSIDWYINLEFKYFFIKLLKERGTINEEEKRIIMEFVWENYIKTNLFPDQYLGNLITQWISLYKFRKNRKN